MELLRTRVCEWQPVGIDSLAIAPSGSGSSPRLAVGRENGALELWDTETWHLRSSAPGNSRRRPRSIVWVVDVEEAPKLRLISAGLHSEVTEWDVETLEPIETCSPGGGAVWGLAVQGQQLFAACDDGTVRVMSLAGGVGSLMYTKRISIAKARLLSLAVQDGAVFAGADSKISKWSIEAGVCEGSMQLEKPPRGHTLIWSLVSLEDKMLASGDSMGLVQIWDTVACVLLHRFAQHQADVLALAASSDGRTLLSGSVDAKISEFGRQKGSQGPKADPEELAKLSLSDLKQAFDGLTCKDGQSYLPGKIMKVMYKSSDHCNYSTSGFDADESMTWKVFLPVSGYGPDVGYLVDVGYFWEKYERGARDAEELSAHVKLFPSGPSFKADDKKTGKLDRSTLLVIMEEMPLLERWVFRDAMLCHSHDVRAIVIDDTKKGRNTQISAGAAGRLFVFKPLESGHDKAARPFQCSNFSPLFQTASISEDSRLVLCQKGQTLELWYLPEPEDAPSLGASARAPEGQLLLTISLAGKSIGPDGTKRSTEYLCSSTISPNGKRVAASDMTGTRLFNLSVSELQVQRIAVPTEIANSAARALKFCSPKLLAVAPWHGHVIHLLDCEEKKIIASLEEHKAPVSLLTAGGSGGEWLASADLAGAVNIFSLDGFFHHASVPVGRGAATALGFDSSGRYLVVATTAHVVTLFDIESQSLHADIPPFDIPKRHLAVHARVCGIAAFPEAPEKLLLWGHNYLLAVNVKAKKVTRSEAAAEPYTWRLWAGIRHVLAFFGLQKPWSLATDSAEVRKRKRGDASAEVSLLPTGLAMEVTPEAAEACLPTPFERKKFQKQSHQKQSVRGPEL
ncbi:U3 small nucleolar RNA-associated protein 4 [Symbiodinium microadriaticum]|uniref:U3 small nucleolar RNA-associated protein 4 n=1 Tax=Symbiodinium microadriaticum TaxID=2951 RepID=A0A1Q9DEE8_SYMMI|nr:U3 small nucleolar RNA-associated protein 4 [Symbiodinium microadriaticum]CAE7207662.1 UTP4 [Symbiodinium microadriaticum]CAE7232009.1 UTP4 [Symbiodinium sp. KB8]